MQPPRESPDLSPMQLDADRNALAVWQAGAAWHYGRHGPYNQDAGIVRAGVIRHSHPQEYAMSPLSQSEIDTRLRSLPSWRIERGELTRTFTHNDFRAALAFVNKVGDLAEQAGHHPDIDIRYNKVRLGLVTHDAGGLTAKDFEAAAAVDKLG
jgi:4a-hydroxytetrahydrobiopterin dehydratase